MAAKEGKRAPTFTLPASTGGTIALTKYRYRQWVVLYFYPKDNTPGCTRESCDFRDRAAALKKLGAAVLGVSPDGLEPHAKFVADHKLNFPLLADDATVACIKYGVWVEKSMYGRKYMGVERSTFLIDLKGKLRKAWRKVKVPGHVEAVEKALKELIQQDAELHPRFRGRKVVPY